jgi:hypothetical protein
MPVMKKLVTVLAVVLAAASPAFAQDRGHHHDHVEFLIPQGTARIFLGWKGLDQDDWEPVESQGEFAILADFGPPEWPVRLAVDLRFAASAEEDVDGLDAVSASWELNFGVRQIFETGTNVRPFIGGGLSLGGAALDIEIDDDSDAGLGFWVDFGVDFDLGGPVSVGLELCLSYIPIEIAGVDTNAGGVHFGFTAGFSW